MSNLLCDVSQQSAMRFIELINSVNDTDYWYHQSLTFGEQVEDFIEAKDHLNTFFDSFEKELQRDCDLAAIYIMGRQASKRVHFHVVFFCYPPQALSRAQLAQRIRLAAWNHWEGNSKGALRRANRLTMPPKSGALDYLLRKHFKLARTRRQRGLPHWNGVRNRSLIKAHSSPVPWESVKSQFRALYPRASNTPQAPLAGEHFDKRSLELMKAYVEAQGRYEWEDVKRRETGRQGRVSDADFLDFLNSQNRQRS